MGVDANAPEEERLQKVLVLRLGGFSSTSPRSRRFFAQPTRARDAFFGDFFKHICRVLPNLFNRANPLGAGWSFTVYYSAGFPDFGITQRLFADAGFNGEFAFPKIHHRAPGADGRNPPAIGKTAMVFFSGRIKTVGTRFRVSGAHFIPV